tara:strand:+ start:1066 stop:1434 length:369 start_codon:yes stop_codon:yes gene_type:complete
MNELKRAHQNRQRAYRLLEHSGRCKFISKAALIGGLIFGFGGNWMVMLGLALLSICFALYAITALLLSNHHYKQLRIIIDDLKQKDRDCGDRADISGEGIESEETSERADHMDRIGINTLTA